MRIKDDLTGKIFERLTVIGVIPREIGERTKYKCQCECGNTVNVDGSKLRNGHTKSCGCIREQMDHGHNKKPFGESNKKALIYNYKHNAKYKGYSFELTDEEMVNMFQSNCYYCGCEPRFEFKRKNSNGGYKYNGIDRLNNEIGYTIENTVSCCSQCNFIKNKYHHDEFVNWVDKVYTNLKINNKI